jgi:hypothetical protein
MGTFGTHTIRIANTSTPTECSTEGFSQTACGIVLEFADIITKHVMNSVNTNEGGWPASEMRTFVNSNIYNSLPSVIRNAIIETLSVSGHGPTTGENNFLIMDKLYLLSTKELGVNAEYDTAQLETRTLDYYENNNDDISRKKKYNDADTHWSMRVANSDFLKYFYCISYNGRTSYGDAFSSRGVSPAFRIG